MDSTLGETKKLKDLKVRKDTTLTINENPRGPVPSIPTLNSTDDLIQAFHEDDIRT